jgi:D-glycerate 3-kinase
VLVATPDDANTRSGYGDEAVCRVLALASPSRRARPCLIGISGLQGSGKSTLARQVAALAHRSAIDTLVLSIDDFYFGRAARRRLSREVHPLLATRGVPGTHDVALLEATLDALASATSRDPVFVPRFDKGRDTRQPRSRWTRVIRPPRLTILEGWCVGVPPQSAAALREPVNALERDEDADGRWRRWVNRQLATNYVPLWRRFDWLVLLQAPDWSVVERWRGEAEQARRRRHAPHALTPAALRRFLMFYERLSRHALRTLPARADLRLVLDADHGVERCVARRQAGSTTTALP